jgi:hypothetical protein
MALILAASNRPAEALLHIRRYVSQGGSEPALLLLGAKLILEDDGDAQEAVVWAETAASKEITSGQASLNARAFEILGLAYRKLALLGSYCFIFFSFAVARFLSVCLHSRILKPKNW